MYARCTNMAVFEKIERAPIDTIHREMLVFIVVNLCL